MRFKKVTLLHALALFFIGAFLLASTGNAAAQSGDGLAVEMNRLGNPAAARLAPPEGTPTPTPTPANIPQQGLEPMQGAEGGGEVGGEDGISQFPLLPLTALIFIIAGLGLVALGGVIAIILVVKRRRAEAEQARRWRESLQGQTVERAAPVQEVYEQEAFIPSKAALGMLIVLESDDPALKGQRFEINRPLTTLGRSSGNDLIFPLERSVSRQHAVLEAVGGTMTLREAESADGSGHPKRPSHGTFFNDRRLTAPQPLHSGDRIRLGRRTLLRYESIERLAEAAAGDPEAKG